MFVALFAFRVVAQFLQFLSPIPYLPAFAHWQSGVLPYPILLASQILILVQLGRVSLRHARKQVIPVRETGRKLMILGSLYAGVMLLRYALHMARVPADRWFGGCIPIFFHLVLAAFLLVAGYHHFHQGPPNAAPPTRQSLWIWRTALASLVIGILIWTVNRLCML